MIPLVWGKQWSLLQLEHSPVTEGVVLGQMTNLGR